MNLVSAGATPDSFRDAMRAYVSGVTLITVHSADQDPIGMTATAFSSVSVDPLLVLICVHHETRTYDRLLRSGYFGVNLLGVAAEEISDYCSRPGGSKVLRPEWLQEAPQWTAPAVVGALAFLDCEIYRHFPAGSHRVVIGRVRGVGIAEPIDGLDPSGPLVHFQGCYHSVHPTNPMTAQESRRMSRPTPPVAPVLPALTANGLGS